MKDVYEAVENKQRISKHFCDMLSNKRVDKKFCDCSNTQIVTELRHEKLLFKIRADYNDCEKLTLDEFDALLIIICEKHYEQNKY